MYQDTLQRTTILVLQWDNLINGLLQRSFNNFSSSQGASGLWRTAPNWRWFSSYIKTRQLHGRNSNIDNSVKFLSLLPLYSLLIFRARTRAVFAPPWASSRNHTTGSQILAASPDFKATFNDPCSLCHLPSPPQDFLKILPQREGRRTWKSTVTSNINQQGKL